MCRPGTLSDHTPDHIDYKAPRCRVWACEVGERNRRQEFYHQLKAGKPDNFLTLTWDTKRPETPDEARQFMAKMLPKLMRKMCREAGCHIPYLLVTEATKNGYPHFHIAMRSKYIPHQLIRECWKKLTDAFEIYIERVESLEKLARYFLKYLTKDMHRFGTSKRYFKSRDWLDPEKAEIAVTASDRRHCSYKPEWVVDFEARHLKMGWWRVEGFLEDGFERIAPPLWERKRPSTAPPDGMHA